MRTPRRGFIMLAVLVCMLSAILLATGLLFISQTEATGASGVADAAQARCLAWSGTQAVMSHLADQRSVLLHGGLPQIDSHFTIYETPTRIGQVRLLPLPDGRLLSPESARLDLRFIDASALQATGVVDALGAQSLVAWRDGLGRPVQSIAELLDAPGVTPSVLYGSIDSLLRIDPSRAPVSPRAAEIAPEVRGLADVLTVFAVEPSAQRSGSLRINLNTQWSDGLAKRIIDRFGADAAAAIKALFDGGATFEDDRAIVKTMRAANTPLEQWPEILDAFTADPHDLHFGRLNINHAPREALLGLPGMTEEMVARLLSSRESLAEDDRGSIAWLVTKQVISPEAFEAMAHRITTRSWTFRIRLAAGEVDAEDPDGPLFNPTVVELVIDMAGPKPRLAYARDITLLRDAALIASQALPSAPTSSLFEDKIDSPQDDLAATQPARSGRVAAPGRRPSSRPATSAETEEPAVETPPQPSRIGRWTRG